MTSGASIFTPCVSGTAPSLQKNLGLFLRAPLRAVTRHFAEHYRGHHGAASVLARRNYGACSNELRTQIAGFLFSIFGSLMSGHAA